MKIILLERMEHLGQMGDVVTVKDGFARNFLLPQKKALRASEQNLADFSSRRSQLEADNLAQRQEAGQVGARMEGVSVTLIRQASESGQLYGSVNGSDVAAAVTEAGFTISRRQVPLPRAIKTIGIHDVRIVLHPEVSVGAKVNVARSQDEADAQASGRAYRPGEDLDDDEFDDDDDLAIARDDNRAPAADRDEVTPVS